MKPLRNTRRAARPVWSGRSEKRKVARAPWRFRISMSRGTPSRVPRNVSTSTLSPSFMPRSVDEVARLGDVPAVGVEDVLQRLRHGGARLPAEILGRVGDLGHAVLHVLVAAAV